MLPADGRFGRQKAVLAACGCLHIIDTSSVWHPVLAGIRFTYPMRMRTDTRNIREAYAQSN
jgi:hypothetical protein